MFWPSRTIEFCSYCSSLATKSIYGHLLFFPSNGNVLLTQNKECCITAGNLFCFPKVPPGPPPRFFQRSPSPASQKSPRFPKNPPIPQKVFSVFLVVLTANHCIEICRNQRGRVVKALNLRFNRFYLREFDSPRWYFMFKNLYICL